MLLPQERIPWILRLPLFRRDVLFRAVEGTGFGLGGAKLPVYLTFDDGPIPESTPWLLEVLRGYGAKATFFMVADNARRYPDLFRAVIDGGHAIGNHTFHHRPPFRQTVEEMMADVRLADETLRSLWEGAPSWEGATSWEGAASWEGAFPSSPGPRLFRPPHGLIRRSQQKALADEGYQIVMFDLNTLDYRADRTPEAILASVRDNVRPGCVINFHDSLKSIEKLKRCLPDILDFLRSQGYRMVPLIHDKSR